MSSEKTKSLETLSNGDRISGFHEPVIHHIMSFLPPEDVIRTGSLSKTWHSVWSSNPNLDFDQNVFKLALPTLSAEEKLDLFLSSVNRSLQRLEQRSMNIHKLKFHGVVQDRYPFDLCVERALERNVKELDLDYSDKGNQYYIDAHDDKLHRYYYDMPRCLYSAKSVKCLKLMGFEVGIMDLLAGCPSVEELVLEQCKGPEEDAKFSSNKLVKFHVDLLICDGLNSIELDACNLQSFQYNGYSIDDYGTKMAPSLSERTCTINLCTCKFIKNLSLTNAKVSDKWLEHHLSKLVHLEDLSLDGCCGLTRLRICHKKLKRLRWISSVSMGQAAVGSEVGIVDLLSGCPSIEELVLEQCKVSDKIMKLSSHSLVKFHVKLQVRAVFKSIQLDACNLQSFQYDGYSITNNGTIMAPSLQRNCTFNLSTCTFLRNLSFTNAKVPDQWLEHHLSKLVYLEDLSLDNCRGLTRVRICHEKLKRLCLCLLSWVSMKEAKIDCPKLCCFVFKGGIPHIEFLNTSGSLVATLKVTTVGCFASFRRLLGLFGHCKTLKIVCGSYKDLVFPEEVKENSIPPLLDLKHLKIKCSSSTIDYTQLLDSLFWLSPHLDMLLLTSQNRKRRLKLEFQYKKISEGKGEDDLGGGGCCRAYPKECWWQCLERVIIDNVDDFARKNDSDKNLLNYFCEKAKGLESIQDNSRSFKDSDLDSEFRFGFGIHIIYPRPFLITFTNSNEPEGHLLPMSSKKTKSSPTLSNGDRISGFPEPVIHHIMSFLPPEDVIRTGSLSKTWYSLWSTYPNLEFDQTTFKMALPTRSVQEKLDLFLSSVNRSLQRLEQRSMNIHKLKFHTVVQDPNPFDLCVERALERNVQELDLDYSDKGNQYYNNEHNGKLRRYYYDMPQCLYSAKSVKCLKLMGFKVGIMDLLSGCHSIEELVLEQCKGPEKDAKFSSNALVKFHADLLICDGLNTIELDACNLQSFQYYGYSINNYGTKMAPSLSERTCTINLCTCTFIKNLSLTNAKVSDKWLEFHLSKLVHLEDLSLDGCCGLTRLRICHEKIKRMRCISCFSRGRAAMGSKVGIVDLLSGCPSIEELVLEQCRVSKKAGKLSSHKLVKFHAKLQVSDVFKSIELDACNLQSFQYEGYSIDSNGKIMAPSLIQRNCTINLSTCTFLGNLSLTNAKVSDQWLEHHLSKLVHLEDLSLDGCCGLTSVRICHEKLKRLRLLSCVSMEEAKIDCPKLCRFAFDGGRSHLEFLNASVSLFATLKVTTIGCFAGFMRLLGLFGHCKTLKIVCDSYKDLVFPDEVKENSIPPLLDLKHLKIKYSSSAVDYTQLFDNLFWLSPHLEMLLLTSQNRKRRLKLEFQYKISEGKGEEDLGGGCYRAYPKECWRHCLERVIIDHVDDFARKSDAPKNLLKYFYKEAKGLESIQHNSRSFKDAETLMLLVLQNVIGVHIL
ncbi:hypothetical protein Vadar_034024 [Vaccinium darrowii]|uniref:Uncharacterized protein n=1 Tax=Vaccinium darrowii TaxID=229202 RepID=A0ACB7Z9B9_9ERIC|nr:hypothetical protein Vadar_034024 [Vaccinium darrowii]